MGRKKLCRRNGSVESVVRRCERNHSEDTKVSEEEGGGGARIVGSESHPLQLVMKTMVRQVVP